MFIANDGASSSSTEENANVEAASADQTAGGDVNPGSSPEDGKQPEPTLLDVLKNVVEPKAEPAEASSTTEAEKAEGEAKPDAEGEGDKPEPTPEEDAALPFGKHPRFKAVLADRKALREQVSKLEEPARQYEQITSFMQANDLSDQQMVELFRVGALIRQDPEAAYKEVSGVLLELAKLTGRTLPADLNEDVESGRITEERAAELSRERARRERAETRADQGEQRRTAETAQNTQRATSTAVADWETRTRAADPDFKAKEKLIADRAAAIAGKEGRPKSPEAAVKLVERAHREITTELRSALGTRPEIKRPAASAPSAAAATPQPKTLLEAVSQAVANGG